MKKIYLEVVLEDASFAETAHLLAKLLDVIHADLFVREYCRQVLKEKYRD